MIYATQELYRTIRELFKLFLICCWYAIVVADWLLALTAAFARALCRGAWRWVIYGGEPYPPPPPVTPAR